MKKSLIALAVLAASGATLAQSSVSIYGVADIWLGSVKGSGVPTQTKIDSGAVTESHYGITGSEDLGGGLKANFTLEQGLTLDTGGMATGQAFSRISYVSLSGDFGEIKLGKVWTAYDDVNGASDAAFNSLLSPRNGVWQSTNYQFNPSNSFYFASPSVNGFSGAMSYSLGENKTTTADAGAISSFNLRYVQGPVAAAFAYQAEKANASSNATKFTRLNGSYDFGVAKFLAGYGRWVDGAVTGSETSEWELGLDYPVSSALSLSGGIARSRDNVAAGDATRRGYGVAAMYTLSKRTALYGGFRSTTKTQAGTNTDASLLAVGVKHSF